MDTNLRIKADVVGVTAETYYNQEVKNVVQKNDLLRSILTLILVKMLFMEKELAFQKESLPNLINA